ncbi:MAG: cellulase family glycosylhydrolase [Burkholderiaceae bacterium]
MSSPIVTSRMTTSLALLLATVAITACGGGNTDSASTPSSLSSGNPSASTESLVGNAATTGEDTPDPTMSTTNDTGASTLTTTASEETADSGATIQAVSGATAGSDSAPAKTATATPAKSTSTTVAAAVAETATSTVSAAVPSAAAAVGSGAKTATAPSTSTGGAAADVVPRPAHNTGTGFYVVGSKLYDNTGHEFRIRGVNRVHWDQGASATGIPLSGANTERILLNFTRPASSNLALVNSQMIGKGVVPMPGNWNATCKTDAASLQAIVDTWVAQASAWTSIDRYSIINIANEWGPSNSAVWRDEYIKAIARMRAAGYNGTLSITSGGCGQDQADLVKYAQAVFDSDPQKNVIFDLHVYGHFYATVTAAWQSALAPASKQVAALGLPVIFGEFGPGKNIGPSPTLVTPQTIVATAETLGFGWLAWAWDDNNLGGCTSDDKWFSMTKKCGAYTKESDLTAFGQLMVPMIKSLAKPAQIFN